MPFLPFARLDRWLAPPPRAGRCDWLARAVYAHRGYHDAPAGRVENSASAFAAALAAGLGIECDVQASRDGQALVFHDDDLARLTARAGRLADHTAAALTGIALLGSTDTIQPLSALLAQVAGRVPLLIEIKIAPRARLAPLCRAVSRALSGYAGPVAVMSFDARVGAWFRAQAPQIVRGLVLTEEAAHGLVARAGRHGGLWRARPDFLAYDCDDIASRFAQSQRQRGLPLLTWTIDTPQRAARARAFADAPIAEGAGLAALLAQAEAR